MIIYKNTISVSDYNKLRKSVNWVTLNESQAQRGLNGSIFLVSAYDNEKNRTVGLTRIISDGGYMVLIADVMVLPEYQGQGIGKAMMNQALAFCKNSLNDDEFMLINLMATKNREPFYEKFGFSQRPNEEKGSGMMLWLK